MCEWYKGLICQLDCFVFLLFEQRCSIQYVEHVVGNQWQQSVKRFCFKFSGEENEFTRRSKTTNTSMSCMGNCWKNVMKGHLFQIKPCRLHANPVNKSNNCLVSQILSSLMNSVRLSSHFKPYLETATNKHSK